MPRRACGHDAEGPLCACIKVKREPMSDAEIERMVQTEREDPHFDYAGSDQEC